MKGNLAILCLASEIFPMTLPTGPERDCDQAKLLLEEYSFDLSGFQAGELVAIWRQRLAAEPSWIRSAVLEALYQGRYKAFSVEQILQGWKRRGHPVRHFNSEFERVVFGPIDPTISKYAAMTNASPSELMTPQSALPQNDGHLLATSESTSTAAETGLDQSAQNVSKAPAVPELPQVARDTPPMQSQMPADADNSGHTPEMVADAIAPPHYSVFSQPEPIRKFMPQPAASEFYHRLQTVARPPSL